MTRWQRFEYVYGGTVTFGGRALRLDGTAGSPERCDEARLRAVAARSLSRSEGVPLTEIEITDFWFSEIVAEPAGTAGADPFRPHDPPGDTVDPFSPGHPCTGDA